MMTKYFCLKAKGQEQANQKLEAAALLASKFLFHTSSLRVAQFVLH
jgi:hypothetical protein